jgi:hypothetical protein
MIAFQSDGRYAFEIYKATWNANRTAMTSSSVRKVDTWSDGYVPGAQAAQIPAHGGLITPEELKTGVINHILMISAPGLLLKDGYKWPARGQDSHANTIQSDGKPFYRGPLPMGTMLALPRNITDASLGLATVQGKGVAKTMRERGGYIKVAASTVCLYVQPNGADLALVNALIPDWKKILKQLVVVTNSTAANPGGPGNRLAPNVPLLASEMV